MASVKHIINLIQILSINTIAMEYQYNPQKDTVAITAKIIGHAIAVTM